MAEFVAMLRRVRDWRRDIALVTIAKLPSLELAKGYYLSEWIADPANRDRWRFIRTLQNRAPFRDVLPPGAGDGVDYRYDGRRAQGLGAAHLMDGLAVSLLLAPDWHTDRVQLVREVLAELPDGSVDLIEELAQVRHAALCDHLSSHEERIKGEGLWDASSGADLWSGRLEYFPRLRFLPRVEQDLESLPPDWVAPVANELFKLNAAVAAWDPAVSPFPIWRSKVTPEGETRKRLCEFVDLDGQRRIFDLHARFTPRAGRLHFRLDPSSAIAVVAYIGPKINA
jgi:hypothetical protein